MGGCEGWYECGNGLGVLGKWFYVWIRIKIYLLEIICYNVYLKGGLKMYDI